MQLRKANSATWLRAISMHLRMTTCHLVQSLIYAAADDDLCHLFQSHMYAAADDDLCHVVQSHMYAAADDDLCHLVQSHMYAFAMDNLCNLVQSHISSCGWRPLPLSSEPYCGWRPLPLVPSNLYACPWQNYLKIIHRRKLADNLNPEIFRVKGKVIWENFYQITLFSLCILTCVFMII